MTCVEIGEQSSCPITGLTFDLFGVPDELWKYYSYVERQSSVSNEWTFIDDLQFTKFNFQMPITSIKIAAHTPCLNPTEDKD